MRLTMKHYSILYFATLTIMAVLDFSWLSGIARDFYETRIGDLLEFHLAPAIVFYLVYVTGVMVFVSGNTATTKWQSVALYGGLFGFFAYATYDLTNMATLRGWSLSVVIVDIAWGTFNTAISATSGWLIAGFFARRQPN